MTENAFAFAASAMIPIGQASTAGNLTFKSTATIVAKEGISMGAGAGAQKITTDVTGNDTAGMVAGMVVSGVTAKGLNGIEAEANKLAKAPKGIDGVSKGAESAAEDAGKVVETSYGKSREIIQCNTKDAAADELAKRIGGQSRSAFADDPIQREFDVISDQYIAQAKPPLKCVNKTVRTQMKATFEAAKKYERKVYYQFEGIPSQEVLDKLYEYSERYGVEVIIDTEPLEILN